MKNNAEIRRILRETSLRFFAALDPVPRAVVQVEVVVAGAAVVVGAVPLAAVAKLAAPLAVRPEV